MTDEVFGEFTLRTIDDTPVLTLVGEVDISNVADFARALQAVPAADTVVVDMSAVGFVDSTALATLVRYRNASVARGCNVTLVISNQLLQRIFQVTNFDREFQIVRRLEDVPGLFPKA